MSIDSTSATPILVCGLLAADVVFNVSAIPTSAIKYRAEKVALHCGGGGCYAAIAISRLGGQASMFARLGNDDFGQFIISTLNANNIDCSHVSVQSDIQSPLSSISIDPQGERQIVNYRNMSATALPKKLDFKPSPQAVLVDTRWLGGSIYALEYAKANGIPGVVDAEAPVSIEAMNLASHIAFSRQGLSDYASTDSIVNGLRKAADQFSAWICVTDGEHGVHMLRNSQLDTIAAPQVNAVDTLGAGDVWHGAFCLQLAQAADEYSAVRFANVAAALKCTRAGGGFAAPELNEVTDYAGVDCV